MENRNLQAINIQLHENYHTISLIDLFYLFIFNFLFLVIIQLSYSALKINKILFDAFLDETKEFGRKKRRFAS